LKGRIMKKIVLVVLFAVAILFIQCESEKPGKLKWKYETGGNVKPSPAIASDGTVYVGSNDNYLYALNPDGTLKWRYETGGNVQPSPAIASDGTVYVGSNDDYLYAFNPDGTLKWQYETMGDVESSTAIGSNGTIYLGTRSALGLHYYLYALNPDGTLKWEYETEGAVSSSPAIASDGTIYIGEGDNGYGYFYAISSESYGLASSPWPKFRHDNQNTGRAGGGN
jgi:outer membrane protein assembly factor BamB